MKPNRINIITLGCAKNIYDSETLSTQIKANNIEVVHEQKIKEKDTIIINTCGFINDAKQESIDTILDFVQAKEQNKIEKLYVMGCLSQRYMNDLKKEIPEVDKFFGVKNLKDILKQINADYKNSYDYKLISTPKHYAYLKISEGCDRKCSFCAIPLIRGKHVSTPIQEIMFEAEKLTQQGVKELIIIAQDTTYYGYDLYKKNRLYNLLEQLSNIKGAEWIRLQYAYPANFPTEILDLIAQKNNIVKYLDIPFQHISDKMLSTMKRQINKRQTLELIEKIKTKVPDLALRTTLLIGHPNESKADFEELLKFVEDVKFDRLGIFKYSHEENTNSCRMKDNVPKKEKCHRADQIMQLQSKISKELNNRKKGKTFKVIIDRAENDYFVGRTEHDSPEVDNQVLIKNKKLKIGEFYNIKITNTSEYDLEGELIDN